MVNVDALNCKDISSTNAQISLHRPIVPADASATIGMEEHPVVVHGSITSAESSQSLTYATSFAIFTERGLTTNTSTLTPHGSLATTL